MNIAATFHAPQMIPTAADLAAPSAETEGLEKACDQFEGMLVRQILQEGLKPLLASTPGSGAAGAGIYDYMLTDTLANGLAGKNAMGISHLLQTQLSPRVPASAPGGRL